MAFQTPTSMVNQRRHLEKQTPRASADLPCSHFPSDQSITQAAEGLRPGMDHSDPRVISFCHILNVLTLWSKQMAKLII